MSENVFAQLEELDERIRRIRDQYSEKANIIKQNLQKHAHKIPNYEAYGPLIEKYEKREITTETFIHKVGKLMEIETR